MQSMGSMPSASQLQAQANQLAGQSFGSISSAFGGQHDPSSAGQILAQPTHHQSQSVSPQQVGPHSSGPFGSQQQGQQAMSQQFAGSQQFRPDMMSIAASAPVPSSNSYCK